MLQVTPPKKVFFIIINLVKLINILTQVYGESGDTVDVLFDECFVGATTLDGRCASSHGLHVKACTLINLSYGLQRVTPAYVSRVSQARHAQPWDQGPSVQKKTTHEQSARWVDWSAKTGPR